MKEFLGSMDRWWFSKVQPESLAILRILLGALAFIEMLMFGLNFSHFYTDNGILPKAVSDRYLYYPSEIFQLGPWTFSAPFSPHRLTLLEIYQGDWFAYLVFGATLVAAVCFSLGYKTKVAGFLLAAGMISFHLRNPLVIHAGDTLLRLSIIYLAFSSCGAVYSLDAKNSKEPTPLVWSTPQRLIHFQVMLVYLMTAWYKWFGQSWRDGSATWYPPQLKEFEKFPVPDFLSHQPFTMITTYGTLAIELALVFLIFVKPMRRWVVLGGIFLHAYIEYSFNIPLFSWIIVACYVSFYEGHEVKAFIDRIAEKRKPKTLEEPSLSPTP